jgi:hypothetical protein
MVKLPINLRSEPLASTLVDLKMICGYFSTSKKSAVFK